MPRSTIGSVIRWILTVLVSSFFPYIIIMGIDKFVGYGISINKHIPDYFLVVFAICINTIILYMENKGEKDTKQNNSWICLLFLTIIIFGIYCGLFNGYVSNKVMIKIDKDIKWIISFWGFGVVCLIIDFIVSRFIENMEKDKAESNKGKIESNKEKINIIKEAIGDKRRLGAKEIDFIIKNLDGLEFDE